MPQNPAFEIGLAIVWVMQLTVFIFGNRIDRKITACQVFFQRYIGGGVKAESVITGARFFFAACQRVLLIIIGV